MNTLGACIITLLRRDSTASACVLRERTTKLGTKLREGGVGTITSQSRHSSSQCSDRRLEDIFYIFKQYKMNELYESVYI